METVDAVSTLTPIIDDLKGDLLTLAAAGVGAAAVLFAVKAGWNKVRSFVR